MCFRSSGERNQLRRIHSVDDRKTKKIELVSQIIHIYCLYAGWWVCYGCLTLLSRKMKISKGNQKASKSTDGTLAKSADGTLAKSTDGTLAKRKRT